MSAVDLGEELSTDNVRVLEETTWIWRRRYRTKWITETYCM